MSCGKLFGKFFTYPPWFDKFCAYCQNDLFRADIARIRTHLSNVANPLRFYIKPFFLQLFMVFLMRAVLTSALFFVNVKTLKQRVEMRIKRKCQNVEKLFSDVDFPSFLLIFHTPPSDNKLLFPPEHYSGKISDCVFIWLFRIFLIRLDGKSWRAGWTLLFPMICST